MPEIGNNFSIKWTKTRADQYEELRKLLSNNGYERWSMSRNIDKAITLAIRKLKEIQKQEREKKRLLED